MKKSERFKRIIIKGDKKGLPYSKGLMTSSIMATGLEPNVSYQIAESIEDYLLANKISSITIDELNNITFQILKNELGKKVAERYLRWQTLGELEKPLIILLGGTTGVGKSTIAAEVAHRLGINRIVSTDSIREVMKAIFSRELMPFLYESSFNAHKPLTFPLPSKVDPLIIGFREQITTVDVGIRAIINRSIKEGLNLVIEGIHIVPGFMPYKNKQTDEAFIIPLVIKVEDEFLHKSHFYGREFETGGWRPFKRYLDNFSSIRRIGKYIESLAEENDIPIIDSQNLDVSINNIMESVINYLFSQADVNEKMKVLFKAKQKEVLDGFVY
ncbi:MAG: 2-phosphoglycerate kinase [Actinomycetia bacterium]|nr:2-phosphoglycerate kinase [Actinomycetes bacterium]